MLISKLKEGDEFIFPISYWNKWKVDYVSEKYVHCSYIDPISPRPMCYKFSKRGDVLLMKHIDRVAEALICHNLLYEKFDDPKISDSRYDYLNSRYFMVCDHYELTPHKSVVRDSGMIKVSALAKKLDSLSKEEVEGRLLRLYKAAGPIVMGIY